MAKNATQDSGSSLSPAPEDLKTPAETGETVNVTTNGRKRKAEATVKTTVKATKRTKKEAAEEIKVEEEVTLEAVATPRKRRATAKQVKYEEEDDKVEGANTETATVEKTVKKKVTRTKKSKDPEPPLEERTSDTKLRIGAHVSVAGG